MFDGSDQQTPFIHTLSLSIFALYSPYRRHAVLQPAEISAHRADLSFVTILFSFEINHIGNSRESDLL